MGMTDRQFASYRRQQLKEFESMLAIAKKINADDEPKNELVKKIEKSIEEAKADIEI